MKTITYYVRDNEAYFKEGHDLAGDGPSFMDKFQQLKGQKLNEGVAEQVIDKQVSERAQSAIVESKILNPRLKVDPEASIRAEEKWPYLVRYIVGIKPDGSVSFLPYHDPDEEMDAQLKAIRVELGV